MKGLVSILALALTLAFTGPAFAGDDRSQDRSRLLEGWRRVGCCDQHVRSEEAVSRISRLFDGSDLASASAGALCFVQPMSELCVLS
jgi:hypothetical protein